MINVLVLDHDAGTDAGFGVGGRYADAYAAMLDPVNFGSSGIVNHSFQFLAPVTDLGSVSLGNVGLVILAHSHLQSTTFSDGAKLDSYVKNAGGSVLALGHSFSDIESNGHANLSSWFTGNPGQLPNNLSSSPYRTPASGNMTVNAVGAGPASGSFGDIQLATVHSGANEYWTGTTSGAMGTFALTYTDTNSSVRKDGLYGDYGQGRYVMVGAVNAFGDGDIGSSTLSSQFGDPTNEDFFLNSIEYLTQDAISASAPEPSSLVLVASLGIIVWIRRRKRPIAPLAN